MSKEVYGREYSSDVARRMMYGSRYTLELLEKHNIDNIEDISELEKIKQRIGEFDIKRKQMQVTSRDLNRIKNNLIPAISVAEEIKQFMLDNNFKISIPSYCYEPIKINSENEMIVNIADWHIGYLIDNCKGNYYNWNIANDRVDILISEIKKYAILYNVRKIYVVNTGDTTEHNYMRKNQSQFCEFGLSEQINKSIELIYRFLIALCEVCEVEYDSISGNHDRMSGDIKENHKGDSTDTVINRQLHIYNEIAENERLTIINRNPLDVEIIKEVNGTKHKFIHGHDKKDKDPKQLLRTEMSMDNDQYNLWKGHYHNFNIHSENNGRYIISTGCLSGYNDYSTNFGSTTTASQSMAIISDGKIELIKDIQLY